MWAELNESGQWQGEIWNRRKNGEVYAAWENISAIRNGDGAVVQYVAVMADITPLADVQQRLAHMAHHDVLTGLANRLLLAATLEKALERAKRHGHRLALLFVDLDHFKRVNDTLGHAAGDELLQEVARRLQRTVRAEDLVARLSGDEFVIVFEDLAERDEAVQLARKITAALSGPIGLAQRSLGVSASVGIALYPDDGNTAETLLCASDAAMYRAKQAARRDTLR
jgi:diguanylate cyclase (GGDEF)-like protein